MGSRKPSFSISFPPTPSSTKFLPSSEEEKQYQKRVAEFITRIESQIQAARDAGRITAADLAVVINI